MNTLSIGKWTAEEMNFLFAILTQVRDEGCKELKFDTYDLREYVEFDRTQPKRWNKTMIAVTKKISQLVYFNMEDNVFEAMPFCFENSQLNLMNRLLLFEFLKKWNIS